MDEILIFIFFLIIIIISDQAELILTENIDVLFKVCSSQFPKTPLAVRILSDLHASRYFI